MPNGIAIPRPLHLVLSCALAIVAIAGCTSTDAPPPAAEAAETGAGTAAPDPARGFAPDVPLVAAPPGPIDYATTPTVVWLPPPLENPDAAAASEAEMKPYTERIPGTDVAFDMVPIRGGKFIMGSPEGEAGREANEGPRNEVEIDPFWMGKCEVTWDEYELWGLGIDIFRREATGAQPTDRDELADAITRPTNPYTDMTFGMGKAKHPAICMTQTAAKIYCKWLSAKTGRYYRLPTEAEWEYACRAGTTTAYHFGDDPANLGQYAWYRDNSEEKYHPIGRKKPNPWGLYDMHGNVAEWVLDAFAPQGYPKLAGAAAKNPLVQATTIDPRVVRGGSWADTARRLRSAARRGSTKDWKERDPQIPQSVWYLTDADFVGFRVVRPLRVPTPEEAARYELDEAQKKELEDYARARGFK